MMLNLFLPLILSEVAFIETSNILQTQSWHKTSLNHDTHRPQRNMVAELQIITFK